LDTDVETPVVVADNAEGVFFAVAEVEEEFVLPCCTLVSIFRKYLAVAFELVVVVVVDDVDVVDVVVVVGLKLN
jgi:hypothetical protein